MKGRLRLIEVGIFSLLSLVFLNSLYHLVTNTTYQPDVETLKAMRSTEIRREVTKPYEISCKTPLRFETTSSQIQLTGPICFSVHGKSKISPPKKIENLTTSYTATVFGVRAPAATDKPTNIKTETLRFSTDFIPLAPGENHIVMQFGDGKDKAIELLVFRKSL